MHYYVSIPALDHRVFKYAGYQTNDVGILDGYKEHGITGSEDEIVDGPYHVLASDEYLGDRIDADLQPYDEPSDFVPKQVVITRKLGDTVVVHMWLRRTYPGDEGRYRVRPGYEGMLHTFQLDELEPCSKAIAQHIEIELYQKGLKEQIAKWRQDR